MPLSDLKDRPFLDVALHAVCPVVTGNGKHFPPSIGVKFYPQPKPLPCCKPQFFSPFYLE
jgi:hypothetical protein